MLCEKIFANLTNFSVPLPKISGVLGGIARKNPMTTMAASKASIVTIDFLDCVNNSFA